MEPLKTVTIYRDTQTDAWMLEHRDDPSAAAVRASFGTTALPTPYAASADAQVVSAAIRRRNPGVTITIGEDR